MSKTTKSIIIAASVIIVLIVGTIVISNIDTSKIIMLIQPMIYTVSIQLIQPIFYL